MSITRVISGDRVLSTQRANLSQKRGFEFSELKLNSLGILMVKAPIDRVSPVIAKLLRGTLEISVFGKEYDDSYLRRAHFLYQYCGHNWTIVFPFDICALGTVSQISKLLETRCIYLEHEDTSGASSYQLLDRGTCIEEFYWGCDYTEEVWEIDPKDLLQFARDREAQGNPIPSHWDPRQWDIYCFAGLRSYQFRSNNLTATEAEVIDTEKFLDTLLRNQEVWLPDWEYFPWSTEIEIDDFQEEYFSSKANAADFVRVDLINNATSVDEVSARVQKYLERIEANLPLEEINEEF